MTDVTGFGLMGHGREMAFGSGVVLEIEVGRVPRIEGALDALRQRSIPAGLLANREFAECVVSEAPGSDFSEEERALLFDPQTSGGLLISVAAEEAGELLDALHKADVAAERIGRVLSGKPGIVLR